MITTYPTDILLDCNPDIVPLQDSLFFNTDLWIDKKFSENPKITFKITEKSIGQTLLDFAEKKQLTLNHAKLAGAVIVLSTLVWVLVRK